MKKFLKKENIIVGLIIIFVAVFAIEIYIYNSEDSTSGNYINTYNQTNQNKTVNSASNIKIAEKRKIENTLSASGQVSTALDEKLILHASYYFKEFLVEENHLIKEGENILAYTNGTYLTAPYDCVIVSKSLPDESSICTTSHYVEVQSLHTLSMNLNISESDINKVKIGDEVNITLTASDEKVTGKITSISEVGTYSSTGSYFTSTVTFINNGNIKIGMSAKCEIVVESVENVIAVPTNAIQKSDNGKYVIVSKQDGITENVFVETGVESDDYVEIKSGIELGTQVIVSEAVSSTSENGFNRTNLKIQGTSGVGNDRGGFMPGEMMEGMREN